MTLNPPVVVRLSQYYQLADQRWSCRVAAEFAGEIPEAIAPLHGSDGEAVFVWQGQPITVWPFVMGAPLDRQSASSCPIGSLTSLPRLHPSEHVIDTSSLTVDQVVQQIQSIIGDRRPAED